MGHSQLDIPATAFSISFGLAGLTSVWRVAADDFAAPDVLPGLLALLTLAVWLVLVTLYARRLISRKTSLTAELTHPVTAPFLALIPVTLVVLAPEVHHWSVPAALVLTVVGAATALLLGAWLTGRWVGHGVPERALNSAYYLPTVAAGLITATALGALGYPELALMAFGLGGIAWLLLGSIINNRNFVVESLPPALVPTLAIDVAPSVVAGNAWFVMNGGVTDSIQFVLAGFAVLMVLVQVRLLSLYRSLRFSAGFWAFTFWYCAAVAYGLRWLHTTDASWATWLAWTLIAAVTLFLVGIAVRSIVALRSGELFGPDPTPSAAPAS